LKERAEVGVKVALLPEQLMFPATPRPNASVKLVAVMLAQSIGSEKFTDTGAFNATLVAPSGSIATATPTYTWNAVAGATQYLLWVDDSSGPRARTTYTTAQVGCASGTGTCSIAPGLVLNPGAGQWWIVTSNASGSGPWSSGMTFTAP